MNEIILNIIEQNVNFRAIFSQIIDFIILFWELIISLSFVVAFCIYFIKFSKSFEFIALRSLGVSYKKIYTPIFYFSIVCGILIYINQSYFAAYRQTELLKNYENLNSEWVISNNELFYFSKDNLQFIRFFIPIEKANIRLKKVEIYNTSKKQVLDILSNKVMMQEVSSSPKFLHDQKFFFLQVKNFFYLTFTELYPFIIQKNVIFLYVFFQKIVDILNPVFLFFIFLGRPLNPRNTDLEVKMMFRSSLCILFIFTSQVGIFLFKANFTNPFLYAFLNQIVWGSFLLIRFLRHEKN